ncbi:hypothetical protein EXIGLDRAFT_758113 [Exidia glandulosa HHB12029]|uniref:Uncharacterized protein n=1 Tax=Exidia glandulosa HHB12029 TaxID=1314781 RepID=A0A165QLL1_EXIGL|nr:hypothetical protein EXIGLDRAFT_758113 [Exidia glandulosa HHB12029]
MATTVSGSSSRASSAASASVTVSTSAPSATPAPTTSSESSTPSVNPGMTPPSQPNLIFGFVIAVLLIFMVVMGGGMTARVYTDRQRRARRALLAATREQTAIDMERPPMQEVYIPSAKPDSYSDTPGVTWSAVQPLTARVLLPESPAAPTPDPSSAFLDPEQPLRELYIGRIVGGRGGGATLPVPVPLSPRRTKTQTTAVAQEPVSATLQTALFVRMPDPRHRVHAGPDIMHDPRGEADQLPVLELGTCEVPWRTDALP